jgi:hypothetical protein
MMRRPLGLKFIICFYSIIGGLTLALSFLQLLSVNNQGMKLFFMDLCRDFIADNTILTKDFLELLPQSILFLVTFTVTFLTSVFHILLAEALYLGNAKAYIVGILFHSYSAVSSFALWVLGINTLKLIGVFFLSMNLIKATYLYMKNASTR